MSEFWMVVNPAMGNRMGIETFDNEPEAVRSKGVLDGDNPTYPPSLIYHFVNGIPSDVTPGREKRVDSFESAVMTVQDDLAARIAKIEKRLDATRQNIQGINGTLEAQDRRLSEHDRRINDQSEIIHDVARVSVPVPGGTIRVNVKTPTDDISLNGTHLDANPIKPLPSSGASVVADVLQDFAVAHGIPWYVCKKIYAAAVADYTRRHPHLTLEEIDICGDIRNIDYIRLKDYHDRIAASRKEPE